MAKNDDILAAITALGARLDALEQRPAPTTPTPVAAVTGNDTFPVPMEYRDIVTATLNSKFGVEISYQSDAAAFELSILVPPAYSNAGKPHWETYKEDRRSRVILNALGANGVREWAAKVYENFDMETRARITHDRAIPN